MTASVAIIGAGRVGRVFGRRLHDLGWKIGAVVTRHQTSARRAVRFIGAGSPQAGIRRQIFSSPVILIAVPDRELAHVASELEQIGGEELGGKVVLHTSGALGSDVLEPVRRSGASAGSLHPAQSFSGIGTPDLSGRVFAVEGDLAALRVARQIVRALGGVCLKIPGGKKPLYHVACVMAAAHVLGTVEAATQLLLAAGLTRRVALRALLPLTRQVLDNFERLGPRQAWTGPLARGDFGVVAMHAAALREFPPEFGAAHEALSRLLAVVLSPEPEKTLAALGPIFEDAKLQKKAIGEKA